MQTTTTTIPAGVRMVRAAPPREESPLSAGAANALAHLCALDWKANQGRGNKCFTKAQIFGGACGASVSALGQRNALAELIQSKLAEQNDAGDYRPTMEGYSANDPS